MISKARRALESARDLHRQNHYDDAASRAYYAVFHILQTLLLTKGLTYSKHMQVLGAFNKEYVREGIFPRDFHSIIERLFDDRRIGDYDYDRRISQEESELNILDAEIIVDAVVAHLRTAGFLDERPGESK
ncbi:MAG: HEPN domain-containing protein [Chloroflexi bacterium]|nr:HEPN domain-containing protein [Chloroflexota bacterium]